MYDVKTVAHEQRRARVACTNWVLANDLQHSLLGLVLFVVFLRPCDWVPNRLVTGATVRWRCAVLTDSRPSAIPHVGKAAATDHRIDVVGAGVADIVRLLRPVVVRVLE